MEKALVVFFSKSGNTKLVAQRIKDLVNADLLEVKLKRNNTSDIGDMLRLWADPILPFANVSSSQKVNIKNYEHIYIGTPVWGLTYSLPIKEFMKANDFTGKKVSLFATHDGGLGSTLNAMKRQAKSASSIKTIDIISSDCKRKSVLNNRLASWINE